MAIVWTQTDWTPSTAYAVNARVINAGNVYVCRAAGVSSASGGPIWTFPAVLDGTVTWDYLGAYLGVSVLGVAPYLYPAIGALSQAIFLSLAEEQVSDPRMWFPAIVMDSARAYLAAHFGELLRLRGSGPITSESVDRLARSYASLVGPFAVQMTASGRAYMDLVRGTPAVFGLQA